VKRSKAKKPRKGPTIVEWFFFAVFVAAICRISYRVAHVVNLVERLEREQKAYKKRMEEASVGEFFITPEVKGSIEMPTNPTIHPDNPYGHGQESKENAL
jgi:hypothetical protein